MKKIYVIAIGICVLLAAIGVITWYKVGRKIAAPATVQAPTQLSVRLSWLINANQAGFIVAKAKGFYQQQNLDVTNNAGGNDFPSIQLVASGSDDIGIQSGSETIISARANNIPVKAIAILDKLNPYVFFSLAESNITAPKDFVGKTVAVSYGRPLEIAYRMLMNKAGVDMAKVKEVKKSPSDVTLFSKTVDVQPGFDADYIFSKYKADKMGVKLNAIRPADYGINSYGYVIFAREDFIQQHPDVVEQYLHATLKGWKYAFEHPEEAVDLVLAAVPDAKLERAPELLALQSREKYIYPKDTKTSLGWMEQSVWEEMQSGMLQQKLIDKAVDIPSLYTNEFLERIYQKDPTLR
jgi:ABC-type nitrate/sulfonate/bicarbonate transport system substrate-binding protein